KGYLEATLEANPEIAKYGVFLPRGLTVILPEFVLSNPQSMVKRLWD
ncbi:tail protein X, partial [Bartonella sp. AP57NXGY]